MQPPETRYRPSTRAFPDVLPPVVYAVGETVRQVRDGGRMAFRGRRWRVGQAFDGYPVAVRATETDGVFGVYFLTHCLTQIDLREALGRAACVEDVPAQV